MVAFASLIGAAAIYAGIAAARPMMPSDSSWSSSDNTYGHDSSGKYQSSSSPTSPAYPASTGGYNNAHGDNNIGNNQSSSSTTSPPYPTSTTNSYGSGSMNWNNNGGYDNCVQQCVAQYGPPPSMGGPSNTTASSTSPPTGTTHTVIVAPSQGVLRYVPPFLNASVGDTVKFMWGANNHTVTKSSQLELCNKTSDHPFASGEQNKSFVFTQVVNDTNPTFFYCGTPTHCEKGMFGVINPSFMNAQPGSASNMMTSLAAQYPSVQNAMSITANATSNNTAAANWGMNLNMSSIPDWAQPYMAENIMYTQVLMAANPDVITPSGNIDLSNMGSNPLSTPNDFAAIQDNTQSPSSTSSGAASSSTSTSAGAAAKSSGKSGASALASPRVAVALVAVAAIFFAL